MKALWITAILSTAALVLLVSHAHAADAPIPIHVFIVWTDDHSGSIAYSEHVSTVTRADRCGALTLKEAAAHVKDFKANAAKWIPHIVCGVSNEHYQAAQKPSEEGDGGNPEGEPDSHPGTGGDKPSGEL